MVSLAPFPKVFGVLSMLEIDNVIIDKVAPDGEAVYARLQDVLAEPQTFVTARERARTLGESSRALFLGALLECWRISQIHSK